MKRPYVLAAVSGLLFFFIFPNIFGLNLWPLAWVALVPLFMALMEAASARKAALISAFSGVAGYPLLYHWLVYTMHTYGSMGYAASVFVLMALVALLSAFMAAFGACFYLMTNKVRVPGLLSFPISWVSIEFLRAHFPFGGFPWAIMGSSQYKFLPLLQMAEITGPYGVSFVVVLVNAAVASLVISLLSGPWKLNSAKPLFLAAGLVAFSVVSGSWRMRSVDRAFAGQKEIKIGIVQANIDQGVKWSREHFWKNMEKHLDLTRKVTAHGAELVIWPEAAVTVSGFNLHWAGRSRVIEMLSQVDAHFLLGSLSREQCDERNCYFNSAFLLSPGADKLLMRYDKMRLVPFSEYVPMQRLFFFADAIAQGNTGSTTPGKEVKVMSMPGASFGCVICYEVIFPHIVRRFVDKGADFMTTITNDAWFGKTGAPYQHHSTVVFRSIENRVYFARAANTGISSVIDPNGRVLHMTDIYTTAAFARPVMPSPIKTFYTAYGDVFAWLNLAALAFSVLLIIPGARKKGIESSSL